MKIGADDGTDGDGSDDDDGWADEDDTAMADAAVAAATATASMIRCCCECGSDIAQPDWSDLKCMDCWGPPAHWLPDFNASVRQLSALFSLC